MNKLSDLELSKVNGGGLDVGVMLIVVSAVVFICGLIDGIARPEGCK